MPTFSIIMPFYNRESVLPRAIESVLSQTNGDWELICVDDGSTDSGPLKVEWFSAIDPRIRLIRQVRSERCIARNSGLRAATGDWICFLDSDDYFLNSHLTRLSALTMRHPAHPFFAMGLAFEVNGKITGLKERIRSPFSLNDALGSNPVALIQMCFKAKHFPGVRFEDFKPTPAGEDLHFFRVLLMKSDLIYQPEITVVRPVDPNRSDSRLVNYRNTIAGIIHYTELFISQHGSALSERQLRRLRSFTLLVAANICLKARDNCAWHYFWNATRFGETYLHRSFYKALIKFLIFR